MAAAPAADGGVDAGSAAAVGGGEGGSALDYPAQDFAKLERLLESMGTAALPSSWTRIDGEWSTAVEGVEMPFCGARLLPPSLPPPRSLSL
eukprot:COSAG06_NODE_8663_length_2112_cov_1.482036_3_plen_90_part_01